MGCDVVMHYAGPRHCITVKINLEKENPVFLYFIRFMQKKKAGQ